MTAKKPSKKISAARTADRVAYLAEIAKRTQAAKAPASKPEIKPETKAKRPAARPLAAVTTSGVVLLGKRRIDAWVAAHGANSIASTTYRDRTASAVVVRQPSGALGFSTKTTAEALGLPIVAPVDPRNDVTAYVDEEAAE